MGAPASVQRAFAYGDLKRKKARLRVNVVDDGSCAISTQMTSILMDPSADVPLSEPPQFSGLPATSVGQNDYHKYFLADGI